MGSILAATGRMALGFGRYLLDLYTLIHAAGRAVLRSGALLSPPILRACLHQITFTGVDALPVLMAIAVLAGMTITVEALTQLPRVGAGDLLGAVLAVIVVRELGPICTALVVVGRSGSAIAAELAAMQVGRQVEGLEAQGVDPIAFLVWPRLAGMGLALAGLTLTFDVTALLGGYLVARLKLVLPFPYFLQQVGQALTLTDLALTAVKVAIFTLCVTALACHQGLAVRGSATEIPEATTRAVIHAFVACFAFNGIVAVIFYF